MIYRLLEATRDFDFNGGDYISLGMVSWTLSVRPGPPLLWVLELGAGQGLLLTLAVVFLIDNDKPLRL